MGNDIAGDDAVGILAARRLSRLVGRLSHVDVVELPWAGLHLLDAIRGYDQAILIDSAQTGRHRPGTVVRFCESDFAGSVRLNSFHDINYPTAIAFGRAMGWRMPDRVEIFAVEGAAFDEFTTRLTPAVAVGLEDVVYQVGTMVGAAVAAPERHAAAEAACVTAAVEDASTEID